MKQPAVSPIRDALIRHALTGQPTAAARRAAAIFLEDTVMVGLAGAASTERPALLAAARHWGEGPARLWGGGPATSVGTAALINAYQIHCQEYDCVHEAAVVHPMAVIGGALLTWAQAHGGCSGRQLLEAICVAVDAAAVLGMMARSPMRFFRPAMCGALGASLGLARLAGLDAEHSRKALGLSYCQISGSMQAHVEGTPGLALQIGFNARAAIGATELALAGLHGPLDVLDGPFGYLALIEGDHDPAPLAQLGHIWQIEQVSHKPFPTGRAAHATLDGLQRLIAGGIDAASITRVTLHAPPLIRRLVDRPAIQGMTPSYARLCLPWLVSGLLARGRLDLEDCDPHALKDPARWGRVDCLQVLADTNSDPNALAPQRLSVTTADGLTRHLDLPEVLGSPTRPLDESARTAKAHACWRYGGINPARGFRLMKNLRKIDQISDLEALFHDITAQAEAGQ